MSEEPAETTADAPQGVFVEGAFLNGQLHVQCFRCAEQGRSNVIAVQVENSDPLDLDNTDEHAVQCMLCSKELGTAAFIPLTILAGIKQRPFDDTDEEERETVAEGIAAEDAGGGGA